jgi:hypothetical protein
VRQRELQQRRVAELVRQAVHGRARAYARAAFATLRA